MSRLRDSYPVEVYSIFFSIRLNSFDKGLIANGIDDFAYYGFSSE